MKPKEFKKKLKNDKASTYGRKIREKGFKKKFNEEYESFEDMELELHMSSLFDGAEDHEDMEGVCYHFRS